MRRFILAAIDNHFHRPPAAQRRAERVLPDAGGVLGWVVLAGIIATACCAADSEDR